MAHIKIALDAFGMGSVELDGVQVPNVRAVSVESKVGELPVVTVDLIGKHGVTCDIDVQLATVDARTCSCATLDVSEIGRAQPVRPCPIDPDCPIHGV